MTIDEAREYTVIVNGGSGCFFQPVDPETTYILTAKHNITNAGDQITVLTHFQDHNGQWEMFDIPFDNLETGINYFPHPDKDIAIIKIQRLSGLDLCFRLDDLDFERNGFSLLGYPKVRRDEYPNDKLRWYRPDEEIRVLDTLPYLLRGAQMTGNPSYEELVGQSGGGIVKIDGDKLKLAGILNKIPTQSEQLGRIEFTPLDVFNEIIIQYEDRLSPLIPSYLSSFELLKDDAFQFDDDVLYNLDIPHVKQYLKFKSEEVINNNLTPLGIRDFFESRLLLIDPSREEELESRNIWIIWLEFLTVLNLVKNRIHALEDLSKLFENYRLLYSDTKEDWYNQIPKLLRSDYKGLKPDGLVIVGVEKEPYTNNYVLDKKLIMIGDARKNQYGKLKIDDGIGFPFDAYKFVHINYFKKESIIKRYQEYVGCTEENQLLIKLRTAYEELFNA